MYKFVLVYNEEGKFFEDIVIKIINNKINEFNFDNINNVKLLTDR